MCAAPRIRTMASMRFTKPLLATVAAVLLVPAAAQAATLSYEGDTLVYRADPGNGRDDVNLGSMDGMLSISAGAMNLAPGCTREAEWAGAECPMPARIRLELGGGDDGNGFSSEFPRSMPVEIYGGDGKDNLQTYNADNAMLDGGAGDDLLK